jgi:hypothetical protein
MITHQGNIKSYAFVKAVSQEVSAYFARLNRPVRSSVRYHLAQFWWGADRTVHYELAVHERGMQIEIGLHFEASPERNRAIYAAFSPHVIEIQSQLGDTFWLEEWDRGWSRLYETVPLFPMDDARIYAIAGRLCEIMEYLQPMYESFNA